MRSCHEIGEVLSEVRRILIDERDQISQPQDSPRAGNRIVAWSGQGMFRDILSSWNQESGLGLVGSSFLQRQNSARSSDGESLRLSSA